MELFTDCCMSCLSGGDFGFFYCLCSFNRGTLPARCSPTAYARFIKSCAGVNAAICIRVVLGNSSKRSAFVSKHHNKLCRWRHLLPLSAVLMRAYAVDGHWAESVHLRMYTNFKPKSLPDKLTQFQRIVLTIHQCRSHLHYIIVATSILIGHNLISVLSHMHHYFPLCRI